ncbi:ABC transporter substrate-binding protein [Marinobacterium arenosum]|uniref:ABC transporter substrate-binding protein n=1 Tax=Marinobacterium arenosum TaxID=2862496 RepID=UPI001C9670C1|nr:ABC transporter substrate-binding protein [Marinobacterium arenosum]MBY4675033.1 ABC transporter substrate-binding protein [Marinobacterium arenosum]
MTRPFREQSPLISTARLHRRQLLQAGMAFGALGALSLPLLALADTPTGQVAGVLKIGAIGPFSGPAAQTGRAMQQGIQMALDDARADGELPVTLDGQPVEIEIVWIDSRSDPQVAVAGLTRAIQQQGVQMMFGGWHSEVGLALMEAEVPWQILHFGHLAETPQIANRLNQQPERYRGWFKCWPSPTHISALYGEPLQYFRQQGLWRPANNRAAVMTEDTAFGRDWGEALQASLSEAGLETFPYDLTELTQTNFSQLLDKYQAMEVSLVAFTNTGNLATAEFVKQFRQRGIKALLIAHGIRWFKDWYKLTGPASDYLISLDSVPIALWQQWWVRRFKRRFREDPTIAAAGLQYDYARMMVRLLNAAGTLELDTLIRTLRRMSYKGVWNHYKFASEPGPRARSANEVMTGPFMEGFSFPLVQLFQGKARVIWPRKYAEQAFRQPPWL